MEQALAQAKAKMMACMDAPLLWEMIKKNIDAADNDVAAHFQKLREKMYARQHPDRDPDIHYDPNDMIGR